MSLTERVPSRHVESPLVWASGVEARLYQQTIAEKACQKNTLVVLPTALGKTIISALAAAHFLYNYKQTRILMMAPTRPLVLQHRETYMKILKLKDGDAVTLTGKTPAAHRKQVWDGKARIIFATPQVVKNDLAENAQLTLKDFSLLVFDECHRTRKEYAYTEVARKYVEQSPWPMILGMTASPGADKKKIEEICQALFIEQIEYRSEEDPDVAPYINPVEVEWRHVDLPEQYRELSRLIRSMLNSRLSWLNRIGVTHTKPEYVGRRDLLEAGEELRYRLEETIDEERGPIYSAIVTQSASLTLFHSLELLETQGIPTLLSFLGKVEQESEEKKSYKTIISDPQYTELKRLLQQNLKLKHPKVPLLGLLVENQINQHPNSKILIFTQYRDTASHLVEQLKENGRLRIERFVGQASKQDDPGLSQDEQAEILRNFRDGDTNALVATCIAEEGLDIPSVDLVIFYEPIPSEIRYIQRKGRTGRKTAGKAIILAANKTFDIAYLYASKRRVERMRKIASGLNRELNPLTRPGSKPEPNPMTVEELSELEKHARIAITEPQLIKPEEEKVKEFLREVEKASRVLWKRAMKAGSKGLSIEDLVESVAEEGITPATAKAAIERLEEMGQVGNVGWDRIVATASVQTSPTVPKSERDAYELMVEKIYPGSAVVLINDKWRARLAHEDFLGPPSLVKKNAKFKARGILYHDKGTLCFRVQEVTQILS
jgi:Fanconi anemia group M protein